MITARLASTAVMYGMGLAGFLKLFQWWKNQLANVNQEVARVIDDGEDQEEKTLRTTLIRIPSSSVGIVLGRRGEMIKSIEFETNTSLRVFYYNPNKYAREHRKTVEVEEESWDGEEVEDSATGEYAFVRVQSYKDTQIALVRLRIKGLVAESLIEQMTAEMSVPKLSLGWIIGKGGNNIRKINDMCRVRIQITKMGGDIETIHISGREDRVYEAKNQITFSLDRWTRMNKNQEELENFEEEFFAKQEELQQEEEFW